MASVSPKEYFRRLGSERKPLSQRFGQGGLSRTREAGQPDYKSCFNKISRIFPAYFNLSGDILPSPSRLHCLQAVLMPLLLNVRYQVGYGWRPQSPLCISPPRNSTVNCSLLCRHANLWLYMRLETDIRFPYGTQKLGIILRVSGSLDYCLNVLW